MDDKAKGKAKESSPGCLTHIVIYVMAVVTMYHLSKTPEVTERFTEAQERDFHVAAVKLTKDVSDDKYIGLSLAYIKAGRIDLSSVTFLLPEGEIKVTIPGSDVNNVTVLERHPEWQLIQYYYGNSHDSISRYRAFKDRIEPVSYQPVMNIGLAFGAIVLVGPALLVSFLINGIWNRVARRKRTAGEN
jgi:hypothetical protein